MACCDQIINLTDMAETRYCTWRLYYSLGAVDSDVKAFGTLATSRQNRSHVVIPEERYSLCCTESIEHE